MDMNATASVMVDGGQAPSSRVNIFQTPGTAPESSSTKARGLQHLQQLARLGAQSGSVAHEIKNALVGVKTFVELLAREHPECELARLAGAEVERIQALVSDMLRLAAKPQRTWELVGVRTVLEETVALLRCALRDKGLTTRTEFQDGANDVHGNREQLKQVFLNLLLNAAEASHAGESIEIRMRARRKQLEVTIRDFGIGMRPESLQRLFEPFFSTKSNGTGLGLSITHEIVQEHGGSIEVSSMPNEGSTFTVRLPLSRQAQG